VRFSLRVSRLAAAVAVAGVASLGGGCARQTPSAAPEPSDRLTLAVAADTTGIFPNPPAQAEGFTYAVNSHLFEGLVAFGPGLEPAPALAERWSSPAERRWLFTLRPGVLFSDGSPLTAGDVVASYRATMDRPFPHHRALGAFIESVSAVDARTVEIVTRQPDPVLPGQLISVYVFPEREVSKAVVPPIGTGPYLLVSREPGRRTVLKRNPRYRGPAPAFGEVVLEVVPDATHRIRSLLGGGAQLADQIPLEDVERLEKEPGIRVLCRPGFRVLFLEMQVDAPPYDDPRVRRALDLAIDRDELNRRALAGRGFVATQLVPSTVAGFDPSLPATRPDRTEARRLLREAGHADGLELTLDGPSDRYQNGIEVLREVARQLAETGVAVTIRGMPKARFFEERAARRSPLHLMGWSSPTLHAGSALSELVHSVPRNGPVSWNVSGLADPALDELIDRANRTSDAAPRNALYAEAFTRLAGLHVFIPLVVLPEAIAHARTIEWEAPADLGLQAFAMRPAR